MLLFSTSGIYSLFLLILLVIAVSATLIAVYVKSKSARMWNGGIAIVLFSFLAIQMYSDHVRVDEWTKEYEAEVVGRYRLDILSSEMEPYPPMQYGDLVLELNKDHTFRFSRAVPFISGTYGKWEYTVDDDGGYSEFVFKDADQLNLNTFSFHADGKLVEIASPFSRYVCKQVDKLVFKRN